MAELKDKIENALNECRMLILGAQVLVGFQYRSIFEKGFESLPAHSQYLKLGGLALMTIAVALLIAPGAYHQIVAEGEDRQDVHSFATAIAELALLPFAAGLAIDVFVATEKLGGATAGVISGLAALAVALYFWYVMELIARQSHGHAGEKAETMNDKKGSKSGGTELKDKIKQVLTEARTVIPGAQALLGFQFATMLMEGFDKLPASSKYIHLASLALVSLSVVLLMTPAAYHRIVERGEDTEHFHRFASRIILTSMVPLALGVCGDFFVVVRKVSESDAFALISSVVLVALFFGLWFGYTAYRRVEMGNAKLKM